MPRMNHAPRRLSLAGSQARKWPHSRATTLKKQNEPTAARQTMPKRAITHRPPRDRVVLPPPNHDKLRNKPAAPAQPPARPQVTPSLPPNKPQEGTLPAWPSWQTQTERP